MMWYEMMFWYDIYDMKWNGLTWYEMIWYDVIRYDIKWNDTIGCEMIWYKMIWYDTIWFDLVWNERIWNEMIRYDLVWNDVVMIWCDMIRYDLIWYEMTWLWCYDMILMLPIFLTLRSAKSSCTQVTLWFTQCTLGYKPSNHGRVTGELNSKYCCTCLATSREAAWRVDFFLMIQILTKY